MCSLTGSKAIRVLQAAAVLFAHTAAAAARASLLHVQQLHCNLWQTAEHRALHIAAGGLPYAMLLFFENQPGSSAKYIICYGCISKKRRTRINSEYECNVYSLLYVQTNTAQ